MSLMTADLPEILFAVWWGVVTGMMMLYICTEPYRSEWKAISFRMRVLSILVTYVILGAPAHYLLLEREWVEAERPDVDPIMELWDSGPVARVPRMGMTP